MAPSLTNVFLKSESKQFAHELFPNIKLGRFLGAGAYGRVYLDRRDPTKCIKLFMLNLEEEQDTKIVYDRLIAEKPWWAAEMFDYGFAISPRRFGIVRFNERNGYTTRMGNALFCYYRAETLNKLPQHDDATENRVDRWIKILSEKYHVYGYDFGSHNTMENNLGELKIIDFDKKLYFPKTQAGHGLSPSMKDRTAK